MTKPEGKDQRWQSAQSEYGTQPGGNVEITSAFWNSGKRNRLLILTGALVIIISLTAYLQIRLNAWFQPFYDALSHRDRDSFATQLVTFLWLAGLLLVLNVTQTWLNQTLRVVLRDALVEDLISEWFRPLRAFRLSHAGKIGANPDQRIHEDAKHLVDLTTDLGIGLLQASLLLFCFIGVLWVLSHEISFSIFGHELHVRGYMVWCALLYAGTASLISFFVGRSLVSLNLDRYSREADLRFALVRANEEAEGIALYRGEADEKGRIRAVFDGVLSVSRRIALSLTRLTWVTASYGWFKVIAATLVSAPVYFSGQMGFGELMVVVGAFNQVQQALKWFVDNYPVIADWQATLTRIDTFRRSLFATDRLGLEESRISYQEGVEDEFQLSSFRVAGPAGCISLSDDEITLHSAERIFIRGDIGAGKTLLFQAIAGLWPWGSGQITLPRRDRIMYLPAHAYVPPGTLREAATYPEPAERFSVASIRAALEAVGLAGLCDKLDQRDRWDRRLNEDEKQRIGFVRALLQRPRWLVLDEALELVDPASRLRIEALFATEFRNIGVIAIGNVMPTGNFYHRTFQLVTDPGGASFRPAGSSWRGH